MEAALFFKYSVLTQGIAYWGRGLLKAGGEIFITYFYYTNFSNFL